jgi:hypothetical protein
VEVISHQETLIASDIVDLKTNVMTETVGEKSSDGSRLLDLLKVAFQKTQLAQALESYVTGMELKFVVDSAGPNTCYALFLHALHNRVDRGGLLRKGTTDRKSTGDVAGITLVLTASVDNDQLLALERLVVGSVV